MMEKLIKSFVCLLLIASLSNTNAFAKNSITSYAFKILATSPPIVKTPIYYCVGGVASPLTATPSGGGTLNWYLTNLPAEIPSATAPTPSTATAGSTTYYVTQTIAGVESLPRTAIVVKVVADNGATILGLTCDPSQIAAADKASSVFFDWSNNVLISDNSYNYTYTIQGGAAVTGTTLTSHWQVFGMLPGQSATLTLTATTFPCVPAQSMTCKVPCGAAATTPNFPAIPSFCSGTTAPILDNSIPSPNGITGTWSPSIISNTTSGSYVFTPDPILFPCASKQTLPVTVTPLVTPTFAAIPTTVCQNTVAPVLPLSSSNATPILGTWNPATINPAVLGATTYTFTPNLGQCTSATLTTVSISIVPVVTPDFAPIPNLCSGSSVPILAPTSPNGIVGTWSPATISNAVSGNYVFTPNANQCANKQTLSVTVVPKTIPNFPTIPAFCSGTIPPTLASISPNGVTGTWLPSVINDSVSGSYVFTPDVSECATTQTLNVIINPLIQPNFVDMSICSGIVAPILQTISPNGIAGTWSPSTIDTTTSGAYVFTPNVSQCASPKTINVTVNPSNTLVSVNWTVTDAFANNQIITISVTGTGNYLYQLDYGPFQVSPIFENVASGTHSITVEDIYGCSIPITENNVLVINYPKYFTPNGDGFNDTWNIFELSNQSNARIFIFDRYGKLLKEISPSGLGWDGNYIGHPMPATDYWFSVEYTEQNTVKKFKSHFSLKR